MTWKEHLRKGSLALAGEDYPFAQAELALALKEAQLIFNDQSRLGMIYGLLAQSFFKHSNFEKAEPLLKQAIELESQNLTKIASPAKTRDLICLSEILRSKGSTFAALACLENAITSFSEPPKAEEINGTEEFEALRNLFASASAHRARTKKSNPEQVGYSSLLTVSKVSEDEHWLDLENRNGSSAKAVSRKVIQRCNAPSSTRQNELEEEYSRLAQLFEYSVSKDDNTHNTVTSILIKLVKVSLKLELAEQSERLLKHAFSLCFGNRYARHLNIPNATSCVDHSVIVELLLTKADFNCRSFDYAAAAKCFADLIKWLEKVEPGSFPSTETDTNFFISSFINLMQKADLYASARILIKQAIEYEEYGELQRSLNIYDKALLVFAQLFPYNHLEIAQVLELKASALTLSGQLSASAKLRRQAAEIEDFVAAVALESEKCLARLPQISI